MEQQKEGIRQEFMLLNWYLKEHLASAVRIAAFIGVFSLLCFLRNVPQDVTVYMIVLMAVAGAAGFCFHYGKYRKHHLVLALLAAEPQGKTEALPEADGLLARDYQQIIASYERQFQEEQIKMEQKYRDMMEYTRCGPIRSKRRLRRCGCFCRRRIRRFRVKCRANFSKRSSMCRWRCSTFAWKK
ncbi:hypothetical protein ACQRAE_06965 [Mediterraneibacter faecis]|uniref:hypothetical protein n=1 Tax=Fusicatenibacter saccharivorans TaxID=1150298 RepID=UPI0032C0DD35